MNQDYYIINGELYHHGVKGMKWGQRKDKSGGTITTDKHKKLSNMSDKDLALYNNRRKQEDQFNKYNEKPSKLNTAKDLVKETEHMNNAVTNQIRNIKTTRPRMDLSQMSNKQMRDTIERERLEREYNQMFSSPSKQEKAKNVVAGIFGGIGTALTVAGGALAIACSIKELRKK